MHCGIRPQPRPDMVAATELQKGLPNCLETPGFVPTGGSASSLFPLRREPWPSTSLVYARLGPPLPSTAPPIGLSFSP